MTTEILRNHLFQRQSLEIKKNILNFEMDIENDLGCVIFDEVHSTLFLISIMLPIFSNGIISLQVLNF